MPGSSKSMDDAYNETVFRVNALRRDHGLEVEVMWECDLRQDLKENPDMKAFFDSIKIHEPLNARYMID